MTWPVHIVSFLFNLFLFLFDFWWGKGRGTDRFHQLSMQ
uniref:Uncharacterized protein n=1 Tax=Rhizophora mucronata TaxID=61149 RepID=A0A2P2R174_RHIMU